MSRDSLHSGRNCNFTASALCSHADQRPATTYSRRLHEELPNAYQSIATPRPALEAIQTTCITAGVRRVRKASAHVFAAGEWCSALAGEAPRRKHSS